MHDSDLTVVQFDGTRLPYPTSATLVLFIIEGFSEGGFGILGSCTNRDVC